MADQEQYGVFAKGGSIGQVNTVPIKTFDNKLDAKRYAQQRRSGLTKGERQYYKMSYVVRPIK